MSGKSGRGQVDVWKIEREGKTRSGKQMGMGSCGQ